MTQSLLKKSVQMAQMIGRYVLSALMGQGQIQSLGVNRLLKIVQREPHAIQKQASVFLLVLKSLQRLVVAVVAVAVAVCLVRLWLASTINYQKYSL
jgi:hypothetical protein